MAFLLSPNYYKARHDDSSYNTCHIWPVIYGYIWSSKSFHYNWNTQNRIHESNYWNKILTHNRVCFTIFTRIRVLSVYVPPKNKQINKFRKFIIELVYEKCEETSNIIVKFYDYSCLFSHFLWISPNKNLHSYLN